MQSLRNPSFTGIRWITLGWIGFISENLIISQNRDEIIKVLGSENSYKSLYASLSTLTFSSIAYGYIRYGRGAGPLLASSRSTFSKFIGFVSQSLGFIGFSQLIPKMQLPYDGKTWKCPMDFKGYESTLHYDIYGVERVTRHPLLWSFALSSLGPVFQSIYLSEVIMFSFPLVMTYLGSEHIDYRHRRGIGGYLPKEQESITSNIPFLAIIKGQQSFKTLQEEIKVPNATLAVLLAFRFAILKK